MDRLLALQLLLAAAFCGLLAYAFAQGYYVWALRARKADPEAPPAWRRVFATALLFAGLGGISLGAVGSVLVDAPAVVAGHDLTILRARQDASASYLNARDRVEQDELLATFESPRIEAERRRAELDFERAESALRAHLLRPTLPAPALVAEARERRERLAALRLERAALERDRDELDRGLAQRQSDSEAELYLLQNDLEDFQRDLGTDDIALEGAREELERLTTGSMRTSVTERELAEQQRAVRTLERQLEARRQKVENARRGVDDRQRGHQARTAALAARRARAARALATLEANLAGVAAELEQAEAAVVASRAEELHRFDEETRRFGLEREAALVRERELDADRQVRAREAGRVGYRAPGTDAPPGSPLLVVYGPRAILARGEVPARVAERLREPTDAQPRVTVHIVDASGTRTALRGEDARLLALDRADGSQAIEAAFPPSPELLCSLAQGHPIEARLLVETALLDQPATRIGLALLAAWLALVLAPRRTRVASAKPRPDDRSTTATPLAQARERAIVERGFYEVAPPPRAGGEPLDRPAAWETQRLTSDDLDFDPRALAPEPSLEPARSAADGAGPDAAYGPRRLDVRRHGRGT